MQTKGGSKPSWDVAGAAKLQDAVQTILNQLKAAGYRGSPEFNERHRSLLARSQQAVNARDMEMYRQALALICEGAIADHESQRNRSAKSGLQGFGLGEV